MKVILWSLICCWVGKHPTSRHDHQPFKEFKRKQRAGTDLLFNACLCEVRGDWKMLAETFHLPRWNEKGGVCWDCNCSVDQVACMHLHAHLLCMLLKNSTCVSYPMNVQGG